nr:NACHT, LRR and PYD domains-containing protein 12-like isoform X3 [Misgurnus anguillicaudatus]
MCDSSATKDDVSSDHTASSCGLPEAKTLNEAESVEVDQQKGVGSPVPSSCVSMKSEASMDPPIKLQKDDQCVEVDQQKRVGSPVPSSCVSMKSEASMDPPIKLQKDDQCRPMKKHQTNVTAVLQQLEKKVLDFVKKELRKIIKVLNPDPLDCVNSQPEEEDIRNAVEAKEAAVNITIHILKSMNEHSLVDRLLQFQISAYQQKLKSSLKSRSECVFEGIAKQGNPALLNKIYTELYITEGGSGEVNNEHEVRQIETASRRPETQETPIKCNDIFKALTGQNKPIRTVLTKGVAGIGKTVSVQKFILDWAEGKANQDVHFIFPLPFRELNLISKKQYSLEQLVHFFYKEINGLKLSNLENYKVIFVFDGLDECRLPLDFRNNKRCSDITVADSVDVLLTNLIKGNLLSSALIWITTRPAAANQIPPEYVDQVTDVRGFSDPQKDEYFMKRINDQSLANSIITHIKSSRSLYIMCHIPVFCWISATVLERMLSKAETGEIPKTLTQMYTHFLIFQTQQMNDKYRELRNSDPNLSRENILSLGKLAFRQLRKGHVIFYEEDLKECGIDVKDASLYSGLCTQIFREEFGLYQRKVFCFVHLSFQEYLAALFVHLHWLTTQQPISDEIKIPFHDREFGELCMTSTLFDLHKSAINQALGSKNGHFDLFLRFLLGLSQGLTETLFRHLSIQIGDSSHNREDTVRYIKEKLGAGLSPERSINLFHCLNELNDHSLVEQIQAYLQSGRLSSEKLSHAQWSALVFVLLTSDEGLEIFDLRKFLKSDDCLLKLQPVIKASRIAILSACNLTKISCSSLASILKSNPNVLRELDLSYNDLQDNGVKYLCSGLQSPHCKLETLKLEFCRLRRHNCSVIVSALKSNPSHLKELDLSYNEIGNDAATWILGLLPDCRLETLRLSNCGITKEACVFLESALNSKPCHLKRLDLSHNKLWDLGVQVFPRLLRNPNCNIEELRLESCNMTFEGCGLCLEESRLRALDLSDNNLQDRGVKRLVNSLKDPLCKLEKLRLSGCNLSDKGFSSLASAMGSNPFSLKELDLSSNNPGSSGIRQLCLVLGEKSCALEKLWLSNCSLTDESFEYLASVLSCQSSLNELDLSRNSISQQREDFLRSISDIKLSF